ncbi:ABC transporter substrate-binding protein [Pendulispora brunnea]|uniref:ABC transporter substrate-binding protein n=1 Tax=Pendulispora brunnea TaxID=2905690 RepID=A0ABZ2KEW8_9BACT
MNGPKTLAFGGMLVLLTACGESSSGASSESRSEGEDLAKTQQLNVSVFPGASNWPLWVANEKGFFSRERVRVDVSPTPNSVEQMTGLIEGRIDIALTAIDNIVAYREGQAPVPVLGPDLVAVMGIDHGFLRVISAPAVRTYEDLRGKTVSVDAPATGFAFVLYEMLDRAGLKYKSDYTIASAGGTASRYQALMRGEQSATCLTPPYDIQAEAAGYHRLDTAVEILGSYQGLVAGVRQSWARANRRAMISYITAYRNAVNWLYDPRHEAEAIAIFGRNMPDMPADVAAKVHRAFFVDANGLLRDGAINVEGTKMVLALRSKYAEPQKELTDPAPYIDTSFLESASSR